MLDRAPRFDAPSASRLAHDLYGLRVVARPLPSERDQNFLLDVQGDGVERLVLKIANALEAPAMLEAQQGALIHLAGSDAPTPRVRPMVDGRTIAPVDGMDGSRHLVWAVSWLDGVPLGTLRRYSPALLEDFGRQIGTLDQALSGFDHPAIHRDFHWDLIRGRELVASCRELVVDALLGAAIDRLMEAFDRHTAPRLAELRRSAIHGDLNDFNVLVGSSRAPLADDGRITGMVDFGDMVHSYTAGDLAIAAAYVVLHARDPLAALSRMVRGYRTQAQLTKAEMAALWGLVALRLCTSVCMAARQLRERPDNEYLNISQHAIGRALPALAGVRFGLAEAVVRDACGLEPVAASVRVRAWLGARTDQFAPVIGVDLRREPALSIDLGVASELLHGNPSENQEPALTPRIERALRQAGVAVGVGRWDEPRLLYAAPAFATGTRPGDERRTIHIGLDLFAPAGTPVYAPLDGVVHAFADNAQPLDFGPVIILRHATDDGVPFFTLYGHLSRASLTPLRVGQPIARGQRFATLGTAQENVQWTPHLHLQIITDLLALGTDFPGVAPPSQRAVWRSLSPDPNLLVGLPSSLFPPTAPSREEALEARRRVLGGNLSLAYREPVRMVRGWMQYVYDDEARRYLDAYNNVPHVGHCHPRVVAAGQRQMVLLNTNTRYLSDLTTEYAARLSATLPAPLCVCYFVASASEGNELALRLARAHTHRRDLIVLEAAYHGHTTTLIDISPYKHAGPGGSGAPDWVHVAPIPDDYRGPFVRSDPHAGARYAQQVAELVDACVDKKRAPSAFIAETCPSVGGQIIPPPGYLSGVYAAVRSAGGVCIADEVQTGLGRMGTHFWAFEAQGVVPDIVVIGKPLGNGHPMAAVVTTPEIAASFDNGMEFFSTFGGNTVSCAIGLAVLDVLRDEELQAHARRVGERLLAGLRPLVDRAPLVGDVRGSGLFLGVELVRDRTTLEPAAAEASLVANRMRDEGILLGTDGPHHNVVKIRPPMPFDGDDADRLVETFQRIVEIELS